MPYSEDDTRVKIIDPKIKECGWQEDFLIRQYPIADDRFFVEGEEYRKLETRKFADYVLRYKETTIAVLEAKKENEDPLKHLGQAQDYAKRLDVPIVYVSNGRETYLHDRRINKTEPVEKYLSPEEIYSVYLEYKGLEGANLNASEYPLYISGKKKPRAYQETAIKSVVENISKKNKTTLLTMATGTGKTYVAFQIIWKLVKSKSISRILFLTDRVILKDQAYSEFEPFGEARHKIEGGEFNENRDIYFSTYQTLYTNDLYKKIPSDFFDLIVIDECHRSRFGDWGEILDHFSGAYHLGMTATPKREDNIDVYKYFGEPVFQYSLGQAIEDGYLVPYKIYKIKTNLYKEGLDISKAEEVIYDDEIEPEKIKDFYEPSEYEKVITIPDQIDFLSQKLIEIIDKTSNPYGKTIVFCADMAHAQAVKDKLNQLKIKEEYATRIVSEEKDDLATFRDKERAMPVIATTVDLLSTGVDIPHIENIVFMKPISSRVLFKQIIGRGSRLFEGKGFFRIIDFTNATRLIDEWDLPTGTEDNGDGGGAVAIPPFDKYIKGIVFDYKTQYPIVGAGIKMKVGRWEKTTTSDENGMFSVYGLPSNDRISVIIDKDKYRRTSKRLSPFSSEDEDKEPYEFYLKLYKSSGRKIRAEGVEVLIDEEIEVEFDGTKLSYAEYRKYSKENISKLVHSTEELKEIWLNRERRDKFIKDLEDKKVNIGLIKLIDNLEDMDSFDVIAHIVFNAPSLTREDRVKRFLRANLKDIDLYGEEIAEATRDILDKYKYSGEENLSSDVFILPNMSAKKDFIQDKYPKGLSGFLSNLKEKIYTTST